MTAHWSPRITQAAGSEYAPLFDAKYYAVLIGILTVWGILFLRLLREWGSRRVLASVPFQFFVMSAGGILILPAMVLVPGFLQAITYIAERMSLGVGICICALVAAARPRAFERWAMAALAMVFFVFLFHDERARNAFAVRLEGVDAQPRVERSLSPPYRAAASGPDAVRR